MSHFDAITEAPPRASRRRRRPTTRPSPCSRTTSAASTACSSTPRSSTRRTGWRVLRRFLHERAGMPRRRGRCRRSIDEQVARIRAQVGDGRVHLRAVRRRRLVRRRGARAPGDRPPADVRLRRHRADAQGRERPGHRDVPPRHGHRADPRRRRRPLLRPPGRRHRAGGQAQGDRRRVHPRVRGAHRRARRGRVPRPGHAVPRPHRVAAAPTARPR